MLTDNIPSHHVVRLNLFDEQCNLAALLKKVTAVLLVHNTQVGRPSGNRKTSYSTARPV